MSNLRRINKTVNEIMRIADGMHCMDDEQLRSQTNILKNRLAHGSSTQEVLPEAYAVMYEALRRKIGICAFDVQLMGAVALHGRNVVEMKTGEGKTIVAAFPLYLHALTGKSTVLITMNRYLAHRDCEKLAPVYEYLGLSCVPGLAKDPSLSFAPEEKRAIYAADIVYTTGDALCFDYLLETLATHEKERYLRPFGYVLIDEADSVLLDNAQIPMVISGDPKTRENHYLGAEQFVRTLDGSSFEFDEVDAWLTEEGVRAAEDYFGLDNLYSTDNRLVAHHVSLAVRAHCIFHPKKQYVVEDGEVKLLDRATGRLLQGTRLQGGQHQAIEAKEGVAITRETRAMATITYQSFFHLFECVAGMTGTIANDRAELREIYDLNVIVVPTYHPIARVDHDLECFASRDEQIDAALQLGLRYHRKHRPVLFIADAIEICERISESLDREHVDHDVLNALNVAHEASIISRSGQRDAVTVATNLAGRGTDIKLGPGVYGLGGLVVIGVGLMANRRMEGQARGRSGRQGDPGDSHFFASLEDDIVKERGTRLIDDVKVHGADLSAWRVRREIKRVLQMSEGGSRHARRNVMRFGEPIEAQRQAVLDMRNKLIDDAEWNQRIYLDLASRQFDEFADRQNGRMTSVGVVEYVKRCIDPNYAPAGILAQTGRVVGSDEAKRVVMQAAEGRLQSRVDMLGSPSRVEVFFRTMTLHAIDNGWIDEVDYLQQLRQSIQGRKFTQRDLAHEYQQEAYKAFQQMLKQIQSMVIRNVFMSEVTIDAAGKYSVVMPQAPMVDARELTQKRGTHERL